MAFPAEKTFYTLDEYFALSENEGDTRYEYHFGEVVAMAGALLRHNAISTNLIGELRSKLKGRRCKPFNSDSRLKVENALWVYPDVMVSCHEDDINARLYVQHPSLIIEVLSDSTRQKDYMLKKQYYFKMPENVKGRDILVCDPLIATADTMIAAIDRLKQYEVGKIKVLSILASRYGLEKVLSFHPDIEIYTVNIEEEMNELGYLVPGLGDAGDRLFQTK